ncbi:hypothetical protein NW761_014279 [Fusarium oxysporum]|nr:hypothetical protein NW758_013827 [Fusarium oxysporum]KAJ4073432.1 hypothetical protein NW761_014279 [Fusarium oxysporum]
MQRLKRLLQRKLPQKEEQSPAQMPLAAPAISASPRTSSLSNLERLPFEIRNGPDEDEIISIAAFHSSVIRPLMNHYISWTRANMELLSTPKEISRTEERRIMRGLYRFQIFSNLFGATKDVGLHYGDSFLGAEERLGLFLDDFTAWEIEEMLCINAFMHAKYDRVFEEVQWDLHPDNPSFDALRTGPHTPPGAFHLVDDSEYRDYVSENVELTPPVSSEWYRNGMVSRGLSVLSSVFKAQDHLKLVEVVSEEIVAVVNDLLFRSTIPFLQEQRRENHHSDKDQAQDDREKMSFNGDSYDSPPLAWVVFWKEAYSNLFGDFVPRPLRQWGYVMWDSDRLANTDAVAILEQEWIAINTRPNYEGEPEDPRDEMLAYH